MRFSRALVALSFLATSVPACITAPRAPGDRSAHSASSRGKAKGKQVLLDNFEADAAPSGAAWEAAADSNKLGSRAEFKIVAGDADSGRIGHFSGRLGHNAPPWPWASLALSARPDRAPADMSTVKAVRFRAKGDGKRYKLRLQKDAVRDSAHFGAEFLATPGWKDYEIRVSSMSQPDWGVQLPRVFDDVKSVEIIPVIGDADYDLYVDDVRLVVDARGASAPQSVAVASPFAAKLDAAPVQVQGASFLLDNFNTLRAASGGWWGFEMDINNLGTLATYKNEPTGDATRGNAGHLFGKLGTGGKPSPWAVLGVSLHPRLEPVDISGVKAVRFWCKGDGKVYKLVTPRKAVTDYGQFGFAFMASSQWTQVTVPIDRLKQPAWAKAIPAAFNDVTAIQFAPQAENSSFDLWVDDLELIHDPAKPLAFSKKTQ